MIKFDYDTKVASFEDLIKMGFTEENIDIYPGILADVLDMITYKNHFIFSRHVIISDFNGKFEVVRGEEFISSFLHLVNNVKRFSECSSNERMIKNYSFDYTLVFISTEEDLEILKEVVKS